jgi:hypothetical protein
VSGFPLLRALNLDKDDSLELSFDVVGDLHTLNHPHGHSIKIVNLISSIVLSLNAQKFFFGATGPEY